MSEERPLKPAEALQERIGYRFQNTHFLLRALTHRSAIVGEKMTHESYQRHEFLGDRVLALVVADMLFHAYPSADEGELARRLNLLVRGETCASVAAELNLGSAIRMSASERHSGGQHKQAILGDAMEAVIGAVYLDGGFEAARGFIERYWRERMQALSGPLRDAKTTLQEWAQGRGLPTPSYRIVQRTGPDHAPEFTIRVAVGPLPGSEGRGHSKREAEQAAATAILIREGLWEVPQDSA